MVFAPDRDRCTDILDRQLRAANCGLTQCNKRYEHVAQQVTRSLRQRGRAASVIGEANRPCRLEIDDQLELGWLLDGEITGPLAPQDTINSCGSLAAAAAAPARWRPGSRPASGPRARSHRP